EQRRAVEQLHHHVPALILAHAIVEDVHDVGIAEVLQDPDLSQSTDRHRFFGDRRARELEGDRLGEIGRANLEHASERAAAEHLEDLELAVALPGTEVDFEGRLAHRSPQYCRVPSSSGLDYSARSSALGPDPA